MQDLDIFDAKSVFFFSTPLKVLWQGIGSSVCLALIVIDLEMVARKFLSLADLLKTQTLCVYELTKIVVVCKTEDLVFVIF